MGTNKKFYRFHFTPHPSTPLHPKRPIQASAQPQELHSKSLSTLEDPDKIPVQTLPSQEYRLNFLVKPIRLSKTSNTET